MFLLYQIRNVVLSFVQVRKRIAWVKYIQIGQKRTNHIKLCWVSTLGESGSGPFPPLTPKHILPSGPHPTHPAPHPSPCVPAPHIWPHMQSHTAPYLDQNLGGHVAAATTTPHTLERPASPRSASPLILTPSLTRGPDDPWTHMSVTQERWHRRYERISLTNPPPPTSPHQPRAGGSPPSPTSPRSHRRRRRRRRRTPPPHPSPPWPSSRGRSATPARTCARALLPRPRSPRRAAGSRRRRRRGRRRRARRWRPRTRRRRPPGSPWEGRGWSSPATRRTRSRCSWTGTPCGSPRGSPCSRPARSPASTSRGSATTAVSPSPATAACASSRSRSRPSPSPPAPCPRFQG